MCLLGLVALNFGRVQSSRLASPERRRKIRHLTPAHNIAALPKAEHAAPKWQAAMEALILVADLGGSTMFARAGWRIIRVNLRPPLQTSPTK
jgi:hypothetical protein